MGEVTEARITPVMALVTEGQLAALKLFIGRTKAVDPLLAELPKEVQQFSHESQLTEAPKIG